MTGKEFLEEKGITDNPRIINVNGQATDYYIEELFNEFAKLNLPVVSQQRELLIGFLDWQGQTKYNGDTDEEIVDWYLKHKDN